MLQHNRSFGIAGLLGVLTLGVSFAINQGPPRGASVAELHAFATANFRHVMVGGYLQAVGPALLAIFVLGVTSWLPSQERLLSSATLFGMLILMFVNLLEVVCYFAALYISPDQMALMGLHLIGAVQHLYFIVAAPALFLAFGPALTRLGFPVLGWSAVGLGVVFALLGCLTILSQTLPDRVTLLGALQAIWWFVAALRIALLKQPAETRAANG